MIIILSTNGEISTGKVINWLCFYKATFLRINDHEFYEKKNLQIKFDNTGFKFQYDNDKNLLKKIKVVWFRKFGFFDHLQVSRSSHIHFSNYLKQEYYTINSTFIRMLDKNDLKWLSSYKTIDINKANTLLVAKDSGLKIPSTFITTSKDDIIQFRKIKRQLATKSIRSAVNVYNEHGAFTMFTDLVEDESLESLPSSFFPSFLQEYIEKEYELRIFYLNRKCYAMAIFSQKDDKTKIDFRNYNWNKPNRFIPYKLPKEIEQKIKNFMKKMKLNTGSIDMIKSKSGEYVFLEVNPVGQFGMVSKPCNYFLEEKVAQVLIKMNKNEKVEVY